MMIAQKLYEGVDIGPDRVGLITYMRTDSIRMSDEFISSAKDYIIKNTVKSTIEVRVAKATKVSTFRMPMKRFVLPVFSTLPNRSRNI